MSRFLNVVLLLVPTLTAISAHVSLYPSPPRTHAVWNTKSSHPPDHESFTSPNVSPERW